MHIQFNQQPYQLNEPLTLAAFLANEQQLRSGIAVAINQQVIPRSVWHSQQLAEGDHIQLFTAIAGG